MQYPELQISLHMSAQQINMCMKRRKIATNITVGTANNILSIIKCTVFFALVSFLIFPGKHDPEHAC